MVKSYDVLNMIDELFNKTDFEEESGILQCETRDIEEKDDKYQLGRILTFLNSDFTEDEFKIIVKLKE